MHYFFVKKNTADNISDGLHATSGFKDRRITIFEFVAKALFVALNKTSAMYKILIKN